MNTSVDFSGKGINGLYNVGRSCYINTSLQCLGHCTSFLRYIIHGRFEEGTIIEELQQVFHALWMDDNGIIPNRFLKHLREAITEIDVTEQNDIHEFITIFIDKVNRCVSNELDVRKILDEMRYGETSYDKLRKKIDKSWFGFVGKEYSEVVDFFYGQTVSQILCGKCDKIHHNYEPFSVFLVPIPTTPSKLEDCLHHHVSEEYLNDDDPETDKIEWKCDGCETTTKSLQTMKFWRLPTILMICLKRFTRGQYGFKKNNTLVEIPEDLDMTKYIIGPTPRKKYVLRSVGCHMGNFGSGHYYALCKNPEGTWYRMDDTNITKLDGFESTSSAYMAFYESV